jgi:hypothetical protein
MTAGPTKFQKQVGVDTVRTDGSRFPSVNLIRYRSRELSFLGAARSNTARRLGKNAEVEQK